jgi:hypothetical protein
VAQSVALLRFAAGIAVAVGVWFALYALALGLARARRVIPDPASPELGAESPAVVTLLANQWSYTVDAAQATLLDLAARGYVELRQPGDDPAGTTVQMRRDDQSGLVDYEVRMLDRVRRIVGSGATAGTKPPSGVGP